MPRVTLKIIASIDEERFNKFQHHKRTGAVHNIFSAKLTGKPKGHRSEITFI